MSKRETKAERILNDARERVLQAENEVAETRAKFVLAGAALKAHRENYDSLVEALTPTPRKASTKKQASAPAQKETTPFDTDAKCGICGHTADHSDHDRNYIKSHDFEGPKSVARAPRKSKQKSESTPSIQSTEGETENALSASNAGD